MNGFNNYGNGVGRCGEFLQYNFDASEIASFSQDLAQHTLERARIEQQKKEVDAQLKSQIEAESGQIKLLAEKISTGHERRMIECAVLWHNPKANRATIVRIDTGELVRERAMTYEEMQDRLPFHDPEQVKPNPMDDGSEPNRRPVTALLSDGAVHEAEFTELKDEATGD